MKAKEKKKVASIFEDKDRIKAIVQILQIDVDVRTKDEDVVLIDFIRATEIFTKFLDIPTLKTLTREIQLKTFHEAETVFEQNTVGQTFYVVLTGAVKGMVMSEEYDEFGALATKYKHIFTLKPGEYFGEIALMHKQALRSCSVVAAEDDTHLLELSKAAFDRFVGEYKTESVKAIIDFYKVCPYFSMLSDQKKVELAAKSFLMKYPSNTLVAKQNDIPYNLFFVAKGSVRLLRRIRSKLDGPAEAERGRLYQVDVLREGACFADFEVFSKRNMMNSVVTNMPTTLVYIPYFSLVERLNYEDLQKLKHQSKPVRESPEVLQLFEENDLWAKYKSNLVGAVFFEKSSKNSLKDPRLFFSNKKGSLQSEESSLLKMMNPTLSLTCRQQSHLVLPAIKLNKFKPGN